MVEAGIGFFEVVRLKDDPALEEAAGLTGHIIGISQDEETGTIHGYGVWVYDLEQVWSVEIDQFDRLGHVDEIAKGEHARRGPAIRVSREGDLL
ncbi:MAG: immunity protein 31 [Rhodobacteraceae bacterium]|nr:immunity protein 31 [Paracoccaceae bacterium]